MTAYKYKYSAQKSNEHHTSTYRNDAFYEGVSSSSIYDGQNWHAINDPSQKMEKIRTEGNEICYWEPQG